MVECVGLEIRYTFLTYRGFESLSLLQSQQTSARFLLPRRQTSDTSWRRQRRLDGRQHLSREGILRQGREFLEQLVR